MSPPKKPRKKRSFLEEAMDKYAFGDGLEEEYPFEEIRELLQNNNSGRHTPKLFEEDDE